MDSREGSFDQSVPVSAGHLAGLSLFASLPPEERRRLASVATFRTLERDAEIASTDRHTGRAAIVAEGLAGMGRRGTGTRDALFLLAQRGDYLWLSHLRAGPEEVVYAIAVMRPVVAIILPEAALRRAISTLPVLEQALRAQTDRWLQELVATVVERSAHDGLTVLAHTIGRLSLLVGQNHLDVSHAELAMLTGMYRQQVTTAIKRLAAISLIVHAPHERGLWVPDADVLLHFESSHVRPASS